MELVAKILEEISEEHTIFGKRLSNLLQNSKGIQDISEGLPKLKRSAADLKSALKKLSAL